MSSGGGEEEPAQVAADASDEFNRSERRRSTTVIMTNNVTKPEEKDSGVRRTGSMRRRLSKQNATIEEPIFSTEQQQQNVPSIAEHPEHCEPKGGEEVRQRLQREDAVVGDDDTKLRPPPPNALKKHSWSASKSMSRESTGTDYSDRSGTDLRLFLIRTLHKSEEDRNQLLLFEKEMTQLVMDEKIQSRKFELPSSYHRMLLHRCAAWFGFDHNVTNKQTEVVINKSDKTKIPDDKFEDFVVSNDYLEQKFSPRHHASPRRGFSHVESYGGNGMSNHYSGGGSQASLDGDMMHMRRAQSFDVAPQSGGGQMVHIPPNAPQRCFTNSSNSINHVQPVRQLSLQCGGPVQHPMVPAPMSGPSGPGSGSGHVYWAAPQRSFDCGRHYEHEEQGSYYYSSPRQTHVMRKAESFGGMANAMPQGYMEAASQPVPVICHHHPAHQPPPSAYQINCYDEPYQDGPMCSPSVAHYECAPLPPQPPPPQMCVRPVKYTYIQHHPEYHQQSYEPMPQQYCAPMQQHTHVYYPAQPYHQSNGHYINVQPEVMIDPIQSQPFPVVGHFTTPTAAEQQSYTSTHQAETANSFIKVSMDGGYGSMTQDVDSSRESESGVEAITEEVAASLDLGVKGGSSPKSAIVAE